MYHGWMQRQDMLDATASERLTLEQEYANQISWTEDAHSHTTTHTLTRRSLHSTQFSSPHTPSPLPASH